MTNNRSKGLVLKICLFAGPFFQLLGDSLWLTRNYNFSWNIWREAASIFFIPAGFLLAKIIERKSFWWSVTSCGLFVVGCIGAAAMMPLFRLSAFYPVVGHNGFPTVVSSVMDKKLFAVTLFPPGLCFPVSLVLYGVAMLKLRILNVLAGVALIVSGVLFWTGNAGEVDSVLIIGDVWLLLTFCYTGYLVDRVPRAGVD
jgi:hypothetical protein